MFDECRYFYDRYTWEIAFLTCGVLNAIQYLEYALYVLMVLSLLFYGLIAGKLIMTVSFYEIEKEKFLKFEMKSYFLKNLVWLSSHFTKKPCPIDHHFRFSETPIHQLEHEERIWER